VGAPGGLGWYKACVAQWIDDLADALSDRLGGAKGALRLSGEQEQDILETSRAVSHGIDRNHSPLATFLVGRYVAARVAAGVDPDRALTEALNVIKRLLSKPEFR
jgi:hypothetical protein